MANAKQKTQVKKTSKTVAASVSAEKLQAFKKWNLWLAILLAAQGVAIAVIGTGRSYPVTSQYLTVDTLASEATGGQTLAAATRHLFDIRLAWVVAAFLLAFALAYFLAGTFYRKRYEKRLGEGMNEVRWAAFGLGGGVLLAAVGLLSGIYGVASLLAIIALMVVGCLTVLAAEEVTRRAGKPILLTHLMCAISVGSVVAALLIIKLAVFGALLYDGHIPGFVYGIYATTLLFFLVVGLLTHFRIIRRGKWADTFMTERAYMVLGFVGASVVAWQMFAGALLP